MPGKPQRAKLRRRYSSLSGSKSADTRHAVSRRVMACVLFLILAVFSSISATAAQERTRNRSIIDLLFGSGNRETTAPAQPRQAAPQPPPPARTSKKAPAKRPVVRAKPDPGPAPADKIETARTILVVGDFMASGLADGLEDAFAESPGVVVEDRTNGSSGLVRDDYYDWPVEIGSILDTVKPAISVVLIGSNDRQAMQVDGSSEAVRSDAWTREYEKRVTELGKAFRERNIPFLWIGAPAFRSPSMSADILAFDGIFQTQATKLGGEFIDPWDGFVDEDGRFIYSGSDINGQQVRLRGSDGINLTNAGKRKLAFYAEKPLRRLLGDAADTDVTTLKDENLPDLMVFSPALSKKVAHTPPIGLDDPDLDGGTALLGAPDSRSPADDDSPRARLIVQGETTTAPAGRADNFDWESADPIKPILPATGPHPSADAGSPPHDMAPASSERPF